MILYILFEDLLRLVSLRLFLQNIRILIALYPSLLFAVVTNTLSSAVRVLFFLYCPPNSDFSETCA